MSNVIVISGGLAGAITAGGIGSNGASFPIKYFLLAYDPSIDPDIHGTGVTSASVFSATAAYGDSSLIQRGGNYIFKNTSDYTISTEKFLILNGSETQLGNSISGSDKANSTSITLYQGNLILNAVSGTNDLDLYPTAPAGTWHCSQSLTSASPSVVSAHNALLASSSNYFSIESYTPILANSGTTSGTLRGVYKCRVNSEYGNFKFNKIGIYIDSGSVPVLIGVACLNNTITKTKTGDSITNLEFDIEIEFTTQGTFEPVVYMTEDYWIKVPAISGYGLFTDKDVAIGSSGVGWLPKAKLDISSENNGRPILCLNNRYNKQYMFFDIINAADGSALSGTSTLNLSTTSNAFDTNKYQVNFNDYELSSGYDYYKIGLRVQHNNYTSPTFNASNRVIELDGISSEIDYISDIETIVGVYSLVSRHVGTSTKYTYAGYFESNNTLSTYGTYADRYGIYAKASGYGKNLYGVYGEVEPNSGTTLPSYGVYGKSVGGAGTSYGVYGEATGKYSSIGVLGLANGNTSTTSANTGIMGISFGTLYSVSLSTIGGNFVSYGFSSATDVYGITSYAASLLSSKRLFGIYSTVLGTFTQAAYAGYFKAAVTSNSWAISADGKCYLNGEVTIGDATTLLSTLTINGNLSATGFTSLGNTAGHIGLKCKVLTFSAPGNGTFVSVTHGLDITKVVSFSAIVSGVYNGVGSLYAIDGNTEVRQAGETVSLTIMMGVTSFVIDQFSAVPDIGSPGYITVWYKE